MPFRSLAQARWAHTASGRNALGNKLAEFDSASKGLKLPARVGPKPQGVLGTGIKPMQPMKPMTMKQGAAMMRKKRKMGM
jgi:hypothetical protein